MMKKIKRLLLVIICLFSVGVFWGCNKNAEISFTQKIIEMTVGDEKDVSEVLKLENATLSKVKFHSSNNQIVFVSAQKKIVARTAGKAMIEADILGKKAYMSVNVSKAKKQFPIASGLAYNVEESLLKWNNAFFEIDHDKIFAEKYILEITINNQKPIEKTVDENSFPITEAGKYSVRIKSIHTDYLDSDFTQAFKFEILTSPTNLSYSIENEKLIWDEIEGCTYNLQINDISTDLTTNEFSINFSEAKDYAVKLTAIKNGTIKSKSTELNIKRLATPNISVDKGTILFDTSQREFVTEYRLFIKTNLNNNQEVVENSGKYKLSSFEYGEYYIKVQAVGNGLNILSSEQSENIMVEKLAVPTLTFDKSTTNLSVDQDNVILKVYNTVTEEMIEVPMTTKTFLFNDINGKYDFNLKAGIYEISAVVGPTKSNEIESEVSNKIYIKRLPVITNFIHEVSNNHSYLDFISISGCDGYQVLLNDTEIEYNEELLNGKNKLKLIIPTEELFSECGEYELKVIGYDTSFIQGQNYYVLSEAAVSDLLVIKRLESPALTSEETRISWISNPDVEHYEYKLFKDTVLLDSGKTTLNYFSKGNLEFGNYRLEIKACGNNSDILSALSSSSVEFSVKEQLESPAISFNKDNMELVIERVEDAENYLVYYNENLLATLDDVLSYDIEDIVKNVGIHQFAVTAKSISNSAENGNGNLYDSEMNQIYIEKLSAPESITFDEQNGISINNIPNNVNNSPYTLWVNDVKQENFKFNFDENYIVNICFNAKVDNDKYYYLDSEISTFTINRLNKPTNLTYSNFVISWNAVEHAESYLLKISKDEFAYENIFTTTSFNAADYPEIQNYLQNYGDGLTITVKAIIGEKTINKSESSFISSLISEEIQITKLATPVLVSMLPESSLDQKTVTITWQSVENATSYEIAYNDTIKTTSETSYTTPIITQQNNTVRIKAINNNYLSSDDIILTIKRLSDIEKVTVLTNETLKIDFIEGASEILVNDTINLEAYDLKSISDVESITVRNIGCKNKDILYLNSSYTSFSISRLIKMSQPVINENFITWETVADADGYELQIAYEGKEVIVETDETSISIFSDEIQNFIVDDVYCYSLKVRPIVLEYQLLADETGFISGPFSDSANLNKLSVVDNIIVQAEDTLEQKKVKISFDECENAGKYEIYINGKLLASTTDTTLETDKLTYSSEFSNDGKFIIQVKAIKQNYLSSDLSDSVEVQRLNAIDNTTLSVSNIANFAYGQNINSSGYVIYYEKEGNIQSTKYETELLSYDFNSLVEEDYFGIINFYVLAKGDGVKYLSSEYASCKIEKLVSPTINTHGSYVEITSTQDVSNYKLKISYQTATQTITLVNCSLSLNEIFRYPDIWEGLENITEPGTFVFEAYAMSNGYINSKISKVEQNRLQSVAFDGFYRDADNAEIINLQVDVGDLASRTDLTYTLKINNTDYVNDAQKPNANNKLIYEISGEMSANITDDFTISIYVSSLTEMNSKISSISGFRLSEVSSLYSNDGVLTWSKATDTKVVKYLLKIAYKDGAVDKEELIYNDLTITQNLLQGISGQIVANVKNVGNITNDLLNENIILDSSYISDNKTINNFTAYKIENITDLTVVDGDFSFTNNDSASNYELLCEENNYIYTLKNAKDDLYYTNQFYDGDYKLNVNQLYNMKIRAISNEPDILYSDFSSAVKIKVLDNPNNTSTVKYNWVKNKVGLFNFEILLNEFSNKTILTLSNSKFIFLFNAFTNKFSIDCNMPELSGEEYEVYLKVLGGSELIDGEYYYISSKTIQANDFVKLAAPTVQISDGKITWDAVEGATSYYIYYYKIDGDTQFSYSDFVKNYTEINLPTNQLYYVVPDSFGSLNENIKYYFGVRAVYNVDLCEIAPSSIGTIYETNSDTESDEELLQKITKLKAPDEISLIDGTLMWKDDSLDYNINANLLEPSKSTISSAVKPFVYGEAIEELFDYIITMKFTDPSNAVRLYDVEAIKLFYPKLADGPLFEMAKSLLNLDDDFEFGWPNLSFVTDELTGLTPGEHYFNIMQNGDDKSWLTSRYNVGREIYIPHAPKISISNYILSWDNVFLPENKIYAADYKYAVISEDENGDKTIVHKTNDLEIDLRELVNSDALSSGSHKIYVMVLGDNDYFINGFLSNSLDIFVLPQISANTEYGILYWESVSQTDSYQIDLTTSNSFYDYSTVKKSNSWDFSEVQIVDNLNNVLTYDLVMQALGDGTSVISGKATNLGKITKLSVPSVAVEDGIFVWDNISGNTGYLVSISDSDSTVDYILNKDKNNYESNAEGFNNYNFRTLGTTLTNLNADSQNYAISNLITSGIDAVILPSVANSTAYEGDLIWSRVRDYENNAVDGYKISFDDKNYYPDLYVKTDDVINIDGEQYVRTEINEFYKAGDYKVYIQAYSSKTFTRSVDGKEYKLLLSSIVPNSTIEFCKLKQVSNIQTENGVISWASNDSKSNNYEITFKQDSQYYSFLVKGNKFDSALLSEDDLIKYKNMLTGQDNIYDISIQTLGDNNNLINSDLTLDSGYKKLNTITDVKYLEGSESGFIIRWRLFDYNESITAYQYIIRYNNMDDDHYEIIDTRNIRIETGYDGEKDYYYGEIDGSTLLMQNSTKLNYTISAIPITKTKFIASDPSAERSVSPPAAITSELVYSANERKISWIYEATASDVSFRIVDELVAVDVDSSELTVLSRKTYISQEMEYYPEEIGLHRISICVVLTGGEIASSYVYFNAEDNLEGLINSEDFVIDINSEQISFSLINNDLFQGGNGSQDNPYIISDSKNFKNINYRLTKPSYFGGDNVFYFKQTQDLTLANVSLNEFNNHFDGNNKLINYSLNYSSLTSTNLSLFTTIGQKGTVKNVKVNASIKQGNYDVNLLYMAGLCVNNYGKIESCQVLSFTYISELSKSISIYYGGLVCNNYANIIKSIMVGDIKFDGAIDQQGVRSSELYIGGIAYNNTVSLTNSNIKGKIYQSGSLANIRVAGIYAVVGGLVATTHNSATIDECFNKGNIQVTLTSGGTTVAYVGGLIGHNQGQVKNSYSRGNIFVDLSSQNRSLYIGGLVGYASNSNGLILSNCYVDTQSINVVNATTATYYIGSLVGYSNATATTTQKTSFYKVISGIVAINNAPDNFKSLAFGDYTSLQNGLNQDAVYKIGLDYEYPILIWEESVVIN